jgi:hypothetical protein
VSEPESLTNVRIIPVMRQDFKTRTTGGSPGDEERKGIRVGFALGSTLQMGDSTGRLVSTGWSARSPEAPNAPASQWTATAFEREIFRERVRPGIAQTRREGRPHGRPRIASLKADEVRRLEAERVSRSEIARRLGIGRTSVRRIQAAG